MLWGLEGLVWVFKLMSKFCGQMLTVQPLMFPNNVPVPVRLGIPRLDDRDWMHVATVQGCVQLAVVEWLAADTFERC